MPKLLIITPDGELGCKSALLASHLAMHGVEVTVRDMSKEPIRTGSGRPDVIIMDDLQEIEAREMLVFDMKTREFPLLLPKIKNRAQWKQERSKFYQGPKK